MRRWCRRAPRVRVRARPVVGQDGLRVLAAGLRRARRPADAGPRRLREPVDGGDATPWAAGAAPLLGAAGVQVLGRFASDNARDAWTVVIGLATFSQVLWLIEPVMSGARPSLDLPDWMPGLGLGFEVEPLGLLFGLVAS